MTDGANMKSTKTETAPVSHTPGPWTITHDDGSAADGAAQGLTVIIEREDYERPDGDVCGRHIAFCFGAGPTDDTQAIADYKLIAAAPELLEALQDMMDAFRGRLEDGKIGEVSSFEQAEAAIAMAEGRV